MNQNGTGDRRDALAQPLTLHSGITLPNRIAKAATKTKKEARKELGDHTHDKPAQRSQASRLVDIALDSYRLGIGNDGRPFAYPPDVRHVAMDLRGSKLGLRQALARVDIKF